MKQVYTYALVKSLYDQGEDYIDCFWPFVVKVLPTNGLSLDLNAIQESIIKDFGFEIPLYTLKTILARVKRKNYVKQERKKYLLTPDGLKYLDAFVTDKDVERRLISLFNDINHFLTEHGFSTTIDQIYDDFLYFLLKNTDTLMVFFNPSGVSSQPVIPKITNFEKCLIEYIKIVEQQKPEYYNTLKDMYLGSIISTILNAEEYSEITEIRNRKFKHCQVFLDTNFIFYLLGMHSPEFQEPAKELFDLLKQHKFEIKAFSFTVDEICRVISGYLKEEYFYPVSINIADSLYSDLKRRGWKKSDAIEFIGNIEDTLSNLGIQIEWVKDIDLKNYNPTNDEFRSFMLECRPLQPLFSQNHDLAAIDKIKEIRGKPVRKIENSKAFFLTSDKRLSKLNFIKMGHQQVGTVCEIILDSLLTNILWLKDPNINISLKSIIRAYSWDLFIKRGVWKQFYKNLRKLKEEGKIKDADVSMLFYHNYIEDALREYDESDVDKITKDFVLEKIEEASKLKEVEVERRIREKENEFLKRLKEEVSKKEQKKDEEWLEKLQEIKSNVRNSAEKEANRSSTIYASVLSLLILAAMIATYFLCKKAGLTELLILSLPFILGSGGIAGLWIKFRGYFKNKLTNHIYTKKLKEIKLEEKRN